MAQRSRKWQDPTTLANSTIEQLQARRAGWHLQPPAAAGQGGGAGPRARNARTRSRASAWLLPALPCRRSTPTCSACWLAWRARPASATWRSQQVRLCLPACLLACLPRMPALCLAWCATHLRALPTCRALPASSEPPADGLFRRSPPGADGQWRPAEMPTCEWFDLAADPAAVAAAVGRAASAAGGGGGSAATPAPAAAAAGGGEAAAAGGGGAARELVLGDSDSEEEDEAAELARAAAAVRKASSAALDSLGGQVGDLRATAAGGGVQAAGAAATASPPTECERSTQFLPPSSLTTSLTTEAQAGGARGD